MKYMHFAAMDRQSTSWQRADPVAALIETVDTAQWTVALPDGNDAHTVTLFTDALNTLGATMRGRSIYDPAPQQTLVTDGGQAAVSHGPCVKHRCVSCHRIFDSLMHGTDCPHCSGSSICSSENRGECE